MSLYEPPPQRKVFDWILSKWLHGFWAKIENFTDGVRNTLTKVATTGVTFATNGYATRNTIKITIAKEAWTAAATTESIDIITMPASTRVVSCICDTTEAYAGLAGTINLKVGVDSGGADQIIADHDVKSATVTKGLADADMGTSMTRAAAIQGGYIPSFTATSQLRITLTSGTGNIGDGSTTNLTNGETVIYLTTEVLTS